MMVKIIPFLSILAFLNIACEKDFSGHYSYIPPEDINDGLEVGTLAEV